MDTDPQKPAAQVALDELQAEAKSPEDQAYLAEEQAKLDAERAQALTNLDAGKEVVKLAMLPDGSVATEAEVQASQARGEEPSGPYEGGQR